MAETSLGEGIGLQQGANRDDFWAKQIYARGVERKAKREKEDEDLIKSSDFKLDYSNKLPVYAKQMVEVKRNVLNKVAIARQNNKNTARATVADDLYKAQLELGKIEQDNARAMAYLADDKTRKDPTVISTLTSPNSTYDDIASIHDGQFFMTDKTGTFAYRPVSLDYTAPKFDKYSEEGKPTGNYKIQGDGRYDELQYGYTQDNINAEINQLAQDKKFQENVWFETRQVPTPEGVDPIEFKTKLVNEKAKDIVLKSIPKGKVEWKRNELYHPPAADKKDEIISLKPLASYEVNSKVFDVDSNKSVDTKIPVQINIPVKTDASVLGSGYDVLDVETNKQVSEDPTNLSFTPSTLQYKNIRRKAKDGTTKTSREWYVLGTAVDIAGQAELPEAMPQRNEGESDADYKARIKPFIEKQQASMNAPKPGSKKTTFNVQVPISAIKGKIKGVDLSELDAIAQEYEQRVEAKKGGSGGSWSYEIKGRKYTEKELLDMGYSTDQIAPYKK